VFRLHTFLTMAIGSLAIVPHLNAQAPSSLRAARVTLVAGPVPSKGGRTEVIRQANRYPQNLVIIDKNANADDLAAALATINALRDQDGDNLTNDFRVRTEQVKHGPKWAKSEYRKWLGDQLSRLKKARPSRLGDMGVVQAVDITLPAPRSVTR
jgi:hypothetical protein